MKLITLNTWGARIKDPFREFIKRNQNIDIFCMQELYEKAVDKLGKQYPDSHHDIFTEIKESLLPEHNAFFRPCVEGVYGIGMFIHKKYDVLEEGEITIHPNRSEEGIIDGKHSRILQWLKFEIEDNVCTVVNVHGLWNGNGKTDTPDRINQSKRIKEFMDSITTPKILCGDFNLRPDTESLNIVSEGLNDQVKINEVTSTRTSLYKKDEKFADYVFTSPDIIVNKFEVMIDEVSDHSPLLLDFSLIAK
ncbi:endonuclease/exonuclease/phosphatase family protein [Patescibacteria group bacterium]|nr:endonuclease/exonuclease/phosphatase family protein [Patescibacteria group bacterium]